MTRNWTRGVALLALTAMVAVGCGSDREEDDSALGGDTPAAEEATGGGDATFGDLDSPCGEGDGGGATAPGVTEDAITIGYGDDAGYAASPGVSHEASDASRAFMASDISWFRPGEPGNPASSP